LEKIKTLTMKKILVFSLLLVLLSAAASAQTGPEKKFRKMRTERGFNDGRLTRAERFELRKDARRTQILERRARRDGIVTPIEKIRIHRSRSHARREAFRFKHNRRRRIM
jgi:hypothetical protein